MESLCNNIRNEFALNNKGTAQSERSLAALDPKYVKVDERSFAEWIVFVRDYARFVQYFNTFDNTADGNWEAFWSANPAIILANLAAASLDDFREISRLLLIELEKLEFQDNTPADNEHLQQHFQRLFDLFTTLAWQMDRHINLLPDDLIVKEALRSRINQTLADPFGKWIAWHKHATTGPNTLVNPNVSELEKLVLNYRVLGAEVQATESFYTAPSSDLLFTADWLPEGETDWATYIQNISADPSIFGSGTDIPTDINKAIRHFFFTGVYEQFVQSFALLIKEAEKALQELLFNWNKHEPHFALFLAFLRLLTKEQTYLNTLTDRHLRFYYERVLRLFPLKASLHQAYLTATLAKHVDNHLLVKGTRLKAGKDGNGKDILFELTKDFVINKAKVTDLRSIFKAPANPTLYVFGDTERPVYKDADRNRYYAATVSNSGDGLGEVELENDDGRWHPFGNRSVDEGNNSWQMDLPQAEIGFAIASHYLYCRQGKRNIRLRFTGNGVSALSGVKFKIELSIEDGWMEKLVPVTYNVIAGKYELDISIDADEAAVLPLDPKVHEGDFNTSFPVLKAHLIHEEGVIFPYQSLKSVQLNSIDLEVEVIGKKDISWSGSTGPLDVSKPFHPFGPVPGTGAVFILGDKETFQKKSTVSLLLNWKQDMSGSNFYHDSLSETITTQLQMMVNGQWPVGVAKSVLPESSTAVELTEEIILTADNLITPDFSENRAFSTDSQAGYLRFTLLGDWGHSRFANSLAQYAKGDLTNIPNPLFDPQLLNASLNYKAIQTIILNGANSIDEPAPTYYHLHPFGVAQRHGGTGAVNMFPVLVPQTNTSTPEGPINNVGKDGGEWLIGLEGLVPPQVLSLLIQVAPGTADPLLEKPKKHVYWSYLKGNEWQPFEDRDVSDETAQLLQSGLLTLSVPADATTDHTLLPKGKIWIRARVETAVDAVSQLIGAHPQAFHVIQVDNGNDTDLGALPLEAGTIVKLESPQSAIKEIQHPYASFGGSAEESASAYYTRTSERLRHKQRAITLWDYERILLQAFPQIHKIKCLNHLRYEPGTTDPIYRELAPGHVTIISVADQRNLNGVDRLRPYTSLADLTGMKKYLEERTSCFAKLHLRNPKFEPVIASFCVKFYEGFDKSFYEKQLNEDIIRFLSPWAFSAQVGITFSAEMSKSALVNFIEEQIYVDYLENFVLSHSTDDNQKDMETIRPTQLVSILVSARQHDIKVIDDDPENEWKEDCGCTEGEIISQIALVRQD